MARYFRVRMLVEAEHRGRIPIAWLRDQPKAHALATEAGLLMTATEVPPDVPLEHLRAWCEALG